MIIKVYEESKEEKKVEKPVYFRLVDGFAGNIDLVAVTETGTQVAAGTLLRIRSDGTIQLAGFLNPTIGLKVTKNGHIKVENN